MILPSEVRERVVVSGIVWDLTGPRLRCVAPTSNRVSMVPLLEQRISYRCLSPGVRHCTGWFDCNGPYEARFVPCEELQPIAHGRQCAQCRARDGFDAIHQAHLGVPLKVGLRAYLAQPHFLYVAVIADGTAKVGTAAECRRWVRLAEQGAAAAEYVARTRDGFTVRQIEDALSARLGLRQQVRRDHKVRALASPEPLERLRTAVAALADNARETLTAMSTSDGTELLRGMSWTLPSAADAFFDDIGQTVFPEPLFEREHGFRVVGALGSIVLVETSLTAGGQRYVADLATLTGASIAFGDFHSKLRPMQAALF
jgi:hypothetical protein